MTTPNNSGVRIPIHLIKGDTSGIKSVEVLEKQVDELYDTLKKNGSIDQYIAVGGSEELARGFLRSQVAADALAQEIQRTKAGLNDLVQGTAAYTAEAARLRLLQDEHQNLTKSIREQAVAIRQAREEAEGYSNITYEDALRGVRSRQDVYGDTESALRATTGAIGYVGGGDVERVANVAAELLAVQEALPILQTGLVEMKGRFLSVTSDVVKASADAGGGLKGLAAGGAAAAAGIGPATLALLAVAAAAAPLAILVYKLNEAYQDGKKITEDYIDALRRQINIQRESADFAESGDIEGATAALDDAINNWEDVNNTLAGLEEQRQNLLVEYNSRGYNFLTKVFDGVEEGLVGQIDAIDQAIKDMRLKELPEAIQEVNDRTAALPDVAAAAEVQKAAEDRADALRRQVELEREVNNLIETGSTDQLEARRQQVAQEIADIEKIWPELNVLALSSDKVKADVQDLGLQLENLREEQAALGGETENLILQRQRELELVAAQEEALRQRIRGVERQVELETMVGELIESGNSEQIEQRIAGLQRERDAVLSAIEALEGMPEQTDEVTAAIENYKQKIQDVDAEINALAGDALPAVRLREQIALNGEIADEIAQTEQKYKDIRAAIQEALQAAQDIRDNAIDKAAQARDKAYTAANQTELEKRAKAEQDYMREALERFREYHRKERELIQDANDERLRIMQSIEDSLVEAEENNNVVAFIRAQREGEKRLAEFDDQTDKEFTRRREEFERLEEQRRQAHERELVQIADQARAARTAADERFQEAEENANLRFQEAEETLRNRQKEQLDAEGVAHQARLVAIQESYNVEAKAIDEITKAKEEAAKKQSKVFDEQQQKATESLKGSVTEVTESLVSQQQRIVDARSQLEQQAINATGQTIQTAFTSALTAIQQSTLAFINTISAATQSAISSIGSSTGSGSGSSSGFGSSSGYGGSSGGYGGGSGYGGSGSGGAGFSAQSVSTRLPESSSPTLPYTGDMRQGSVYAPVTQGGNTFHISIDGAGGLSEDRVRVVLKQAFDKAADRFEAAQRP